MTPRTRALIAKALDAATPIDEQRTTALVALKYLVREGIVSPLEQSDDDEGEADDADADVRPGACLAVIAPGERGSVYQFCPRPTTTKRCAGHRSTESAYSVAMRGGWHAVTCSRCQHAWSMATGEPLEFHAFGSLLVSHWRCRPWLVLWPKIVRATFESYAKTLPHRSFVAVAPRRR